MNKTLFSWLIDSNEDTVCQPPLGHDLIEKTIKSTSDEILKRIFNNPIDDNIDIWFYDYNIKKSNSKELKNHIYKTNESISLIAFKLYDEKENDNKTKYTFTSDNRLYSIGIDKNLWKISFKTRVVFKSQLIKIEKIIKILNDINDFLNMVALQDINKIMIYSFKIHSLMNYKCILSKMFIKENSYYRICISENLQNKMIYSFCGINTIEKFKNILDRQSIKFDKISKKEKEKQFYQIKRKKEPRQWTDEEKKAIESLDMEGLSKITVNDVFNVMEGNNNG